LTAYIIRRFTILIPTFFGITVIVFALIQLAPGNIIDFYLSANPNIETDQNQLQAIEHRLGLDKPVYVQYLIWVKNLLCFNFGYSFSTNRSIAQDIAPRLLASLTLFLFSHMIGWPIAIVIGILSAIKPNSIWDHIGRAVGLAGISMPAYWVGLMLILIFAVWLRWFPTSGMVSTSVEFHNVFQYLGDRLWYLVLPSMTIALRSVATTMRVTRAEMLEVLGKDYITSARAKGLSEQIVYWKHALRNALLPVVTLIGLGMGGILSGAVLTETVFAWPGIGRYFVHSIHVRDYPAVMAVVVIASLMVLLANAITDVVYSFIDPRVRY